jgi:hypothetical protein
MKTTAFSHGQLPFLLQVQQPARRSQSMFEALWEPGKSEILAEIIYAGCISTVPALPLSTPKPPP